MLTSSWMRYVYHSDMDRFEQFARRVFHVDYPAYDKEGTICEGICRLERFFRRLGLPCDASRLDMSEEVMERLARQAVYKSPTKGRFQVLQREDLVNILRIASEKSPIS